MSEMVERVGCEHRWFIHPSIVHALTCVRCRATLVLTAPTEVAVVAHEGRWDYMSRFGASGPRYLPSLSDPA